jgi:Bacterial Ig-like domain (group 2)
MIRRLSFAALLAAVLSLAACDGGGSDPRTVVAVSPAAQTRVAGETQQFAATVNGGAPASGTTVAWSSSNTAVATVDAATGLATTKAAGTTTIRATIRGVSGEATLTVVANTAPTADAGADRDVARGATVTLAATGADAEGQALTYRWEQVAGADVTGGQTFLSGASPTFTAPAGVDAVRFSLVATDASGMDSPADEVTVFVLEDPAKAVWVRPTGDDAAAGTRAAPVRTLARALTLAAANGADVYAAEGQYNEAVTLRNGVSMYGGFATAWGTRYPVESLGHRAIVSAPGTAVSGRLVTDLTIDGFHVLGQTPTAGGASSAYGIRLDFAQRVTISHNAVSTGPGRAGSAGAPGATGAAGQRGGDSPGEVTPGLPGGNGGAGGRGGTESAAATAGANGGAGSGTPGIGGPPATSNAGGGPGGTGGIGAPGAIGAGSDDFVGYNPNEGYLPRFGLAGGSGAIGGGGGGGGGGRNVTVVIINYHGGGGGGGGSGGLGGSGGGGGGGGGGAFGILLYASTEIVLRENIVSPGPGGAGGAGGSGGAGGPGGLGGNGFNTGSTDGRIGGNGGMGGAGGGGGQGGGGGGGPSIGIAVLGASTYTSTGNSVTSSLGGTGGAPNGTVGRSVTLFVQP